MAKKITVFHVGDRLMRYRKLTMGTKPASGELTKALLPLFQSIQEAHIIVLFTSLHIIALNETKIDPGYPSELTVIRGYQEE